MASPGHRDARCDVKYESIDGEEEIEGDGETEGGERRETEEERDEVKEEQKEIEEERGKTEGEEIGETEGRGEVKEEKQKEIEEEERGETEEGGEVKEEKQKEIDEGERGEIEDEKLMGEGGEGGEEEEQREDGFNAGQEETTDGPCEAVKKSSTTAITYATPGEPMAGIGLKDHATEGGKYAPLEEEEKGSTRNGSKYSKKLRVLIPFRLKPVNEEYCPLDHCGFFSFIWMSWMSPLFYKAYRRTLQYSDLWTMSDEDKGAHNGNRIERLWEEELERRGEESSSMGRVALRFVFTRQLVSLIALIISTMATFITSAVLVEKLLAYTESSEVDIGYGIVLVIGVFFLNLVRIGGDVYFWVANCRTATRLRSATLTLAFRRLAHLRSLKEHSVGEIVNICTNDSQRLFDACIIGNFIFSSIVMLIAATIATYIIVGPGALIGTFSTFFLFFPLQMLIGRISTMDRIKCIAVTDKRVQKTNEILTYVKLIKMYAWEKPFAKTIAGIRSMERRMLEKAGFLQSYMISIIPVVPSLASVSSILIHVALGNPLTASEAFTLVALLNVLRVVVGPTPFVVRMLGEAAVALSRLKEIIILGKMEPNPRLDDCSHYMVEITEGTFGWDAVKGEKEKEKENEKEKGNGVATRRKASENPQSPIDKENADAQETLMSPVANGHTPSRLPEGATYNPAEISPTIFDINFKLAKGSLTGICGLVGSGKTSLISAVLGQMRTIEGVCRVGGRFAYVAQEAWIFNGTVQENILFGVEMDASRYDQVLDVCGLQPDLDILHDGDQTEIGERGINLSGGQKQRISLARAVYSDRDVYLLDDPLSAVDAHVGEHIFQGCINGVLKDKTVLFVTHQLQYLQDCDSILVMSEGRIAEQGRHKTLMEEGGEYARLIASHYIDTAQDEEEQGMAEQVSKV